MGLFTQKSDVEEAKRALEAAKAKLREVSTLYRMKPLIGAGLVLIAFGLMVLLSN